MPDHRRRRPDFWNVTDKGREEAQARAICQYPTRDGGADKILAIIDR